MNLVEQLTIQPRDTATVDLTALLIPMSSRMNTLTSSLGPAAEWGGVSHMIVLTTVEEGTDAMGDLLLQSFEAPNLFAKTHQRLARRSNRPV